MKRKYLYLVLAIAGLCYTWYYNLQFYQQSADPSIAHFIAQTTTTLAAKSLAADLTIVVLVFFAWMIPESIKLQIKYWWILIPLTFLIAIAFTFPLFLYIREKRLAQLQQIPTS